MQIASLGRKRQALVAIALGLSLVVPWPAVSLPPASAAQNLVFVSGAFRRSIAVADLEHLAKTGQARGLLADVLSFSRQNPQEIAKLLNQSVSLPVTLVSRLLNTRIGEAILQRLSVIVFPLKASQAGIPAMRSAMRISKSRASITSTGSGGRRWAWGTSSRAPRTSRR